MLIMIVGCPFTYTRCTFVVEGHHQRIDFDTYKCLVIGQCIVFMTRRVVEAKMNFSTLQQKQIQTQKYKKTRKKSLCLFVNFNQHLGFQFSSMIKKKIMRL